MLPHRYLHRLLRVALPAASLLLILGLRSAYAQ